MTSQLRGFLRTSGSSPEHHLLVNGRPAFTRALHRVNFLAA